ncbi:hypothetical protein M3Y99_01397600 [Aphelenchoides fujianensis]|nr:hypothetical protein M3Y99_01397600 [Aphelenchoides fujianensis]
MADQEPEQAGPPPGEGDPAQNPEAQAQQQPRRAPDQNATFLRAARAGNLDQVLEFLHNGININTSNSNGLNALHLASKEGHNEVVRELIRRGADVDAATRKGNTALHIASLAGQDIIVTIPVENGANVNAQSLNGFTPLYMAAQENHEAVVRYLLAHNANQALATEDGFTPLAVALQQGHDRVVALLLENDNNSKVKLPALHIAAKKDDTRAATLLLQSEQNPNVTSKSGFTPLHIASHYGNENVAQLLIEKGANVNYQARHDISPLHVAAKWGRVNLVKILLQNGALIDCRTRDLLTPLHCAARSGHELVVDLLLENHAPIGAKTKNGLAPLHMASQGDHVDCARNLLYHQAPVDDVTAAKLLLDRHADPNARALNGFTPLHIACKKNRIKVVELLLKYYASLEATTESGLSPLHVAAFMGCINIVIFLIQQGAKVDVETVRGETPLHLAARANQTDIVRVLVRNGAKVDAQARELQTPLHIASPTGQHGHLVAGERRVRTSDGEERLHAAPHCRQEEPNGHRECAASYKADPNARSKAGFTPLHLASESGHTEMTGLLIENGSGVNERANNGLTPLHLCAQEDKVDVARVLLSNGAEVNAQTKAGYTPLHVACHFGQLNMIRLLIEHGALVSAETTAGYTPLHQAAQQGHNNVVRYLLEHGASPNSKTVEGQTPLSIAQRFGYVSVVETLKTVTETTVITETTTVTEDRYKPQNPERMNETMFSDSEDEVDEIQASAQDHARDFNESITQGLHDSAVIHLIHTGEQMKSSAFDTTDADLDAVIKRAQAEPVTTAIPDPTFLDHSADDNVVITRDTVQPSKLFMKTFLISFLVDARGGAMRGCRHSGVRVIIPPRKAAAPMRITCRYLRKEKLAHPPPLSEGEALASRILEMGPHSAKFLGPVVLEVPHFASLRGREREIKSTALGPEGGVILSSVVPRVQAIFPDGSLTKTIKVSLQAQPVPNEIVVKLHGNRVAVSPIVTVEPRRRKFHKPITLCIPLPQSGNKGMLTQYNSAQPGQEPPTLRLLCSITGGSSPAQWEDITGTTQLTFTGEEVSFTTTVSARFWLMDCQTPRDAARMAQEVYNEAIAVPYMAKFVVFSRRPLPNEGQLRLFCMTDDREDKTLEKQEGFIEVAKSRDVEVLSSRHQFLEFRGNLVPITKSGDQLRVFFLPFQENRLAFNVKVRQHDDQEAATSGQIAIMKEERIRAENIPPQHPICTLSITLPDYRGQLPPLQRSFRDHQVEAIATKYAPALSKEMDGDLATQIDFVSRKIGGDWMRMSRSLGVSDADTRQIKRELPNQEPLTVLKIWSFSPNCTKPCAGIGRDDIVHKLQRGDLDSDSLRLIDSSNLHLDRTSITSRDDLRAAEKSPAAVDVQTTVTRTERRVRKSPDAAEPVVDERTITRYIRDNATVEEVVSERQSLPLNEVERDHWLRDPHEEPEAEEIFHNSREAMVLHNVQETPEGFVETTTLVTQHIIPEAEPTSTVVPEIQELEAQEEAGQPSSAHDSSPIVEEPPADESPSDKLPTPQFEEHPNEMETSATDSIIHHEDVPKAEPSPVRSVEHEPSPHHEDESPHLLQESVIEETEEEHEPSPAVASEPEPHLRGEGREEED